MPIYGHCGDLKSCGGLLVKGKKVICEDGSIQKTPSITTQTLCVSQKVVTPIVVEETVEVGDILVPSTTRDRIMKKSTGSENIKVVGVACSAGTANSTVKMVIGGEFQVKVSGTIDRGDFIETSGSGSGVGVVDTDDFASFAMATESSANAAVKLVWARFIKAEVY